MRPSRCLCARLSSLLENVLTSNTDSRISWRTWLLPDALFSCRDHIVTYATASRGRTAKRPRCAAQPRATSKGLACRRRRLSRSAPSAHQGGPGPQRGFGDADARTHVRACVARGEQDLLSHWPGMAPSPCFVERSWRVALLLCLCEAEAYFGRAPDFRTSLQRVLDPRQSRRDPQQHCMSAINPQASSTQSSERLYLRVQARRLPRSINVLNPARTAKQSCR